MLDLTPYSSDVARLCRDSRARRLEVFGSATRDDFSSSTSDIDFLVEFDDLPPSQYADAYFSLKEGLEAIFNRNVDLVTTRNLENPYFRQRISEEARTVYAG